MSRHRKGKSGNSGSMFSMDNLSSLMNNIDMGTLSSLLTQVSGNSNPLSVLMSKFSKPDQTSKPTLKQNSNRKNTNSKNTNSNDNSNIKENPFGEIDIEAIKNMFSKIDFGNTTSNRNSESLNSLEEYVNSNINSDGNDDGEDVIVMLRLLKHFLDENRAKVLDAMIKLYNENTK